MQLKRLEIKGFKSFADKTIIDFTDGITAVVGPNGSGKSNIIEAIRWVMGEQSAKTLRGGRMHDVIFSGTDTRKAVNIAEVTLVLDNQDGFLPIDFEEVSIKRRINRNGDSDYYINKETCRLKDIVDLFMDSGLGKESFSIISQGQVEAIFNSKAEDRRSIFEEAAGVFKYKLHKEKAERKLFETQDNLDRVQDILYELNAQVEPLRKQKDSAESYVAQKEELTDLDIALSVLKINQYSKELTDSKETISRLSKEAEELQSSIEKETSEMKKHKHTLHESEVKRETIQANTIETVQQLERTEARLGLVEEREKHKDALLFEKEDNLKHARLQLEELENDRQTISDEYATQQRRVTHYKKEYNQLNEQLNRLTGNKEEALESLRADYIDAMQKKASLTNEVTYLERQLQQSTMQREKHNLSSENVQKALLVAKQSLEEKQGLLKECKASIEHLLQDYKETKVSLDQIQEAFKQKTARLQQMESQLNRAQAKQSSLLEMQENYAGYFAGVKAVMTAKQSLNGIVGTVADLIDVPVDYTEAIDVVLGASSQFVVVEDEKSARDSIQFLKNKRAGRATFLPLTTIKKRSLSATYRYNASLVDGFVGVASELITYDDHVSHVIENLLGNTIVAKDLESANAIARAVQFNVRVVSLEGDMMNAGGSMTGGGGKRSSNAHLFSQKKEEKALRIEIDELEKSIQLRTNELTSDRERVSELTERLEVKRLAGEDHRLLERQLENDVDQFESSVVRLEREEKGLRYEFEEASSEVIRLTDQLKTVKENLLDAEQSRERIDDEMKQLSSEKEDRQSQQERIEKERALVMEDWNKARETLASVQSKKESIDLRIKDTQAMINSLTSQLDDLKTGEVLESKEELHDQLTHLKDKLATLKENERSLKEEQSRVEANIASLEDSSELLQTKRVHILDEKNKLAIQFSRLDVSIDHLLNYLSEEYAISYEEAKLNQPVDLDVEYTQKRVKLLKKGIEELGPVNLASIEEYARVAERYEFLSTQQSDLLEAKAKLYDTMDQMDNEVKRRFLETFNQIKDQFALVFPRMFGGGKAELLLTDPDDLLHSGVEIIAQPPGKKLQSLSLLSGGERALTALSLLFAIIQVRPIPFCILDEAEAALDETNVTRFGRYLHEFASDTQFIVITHRKGTMEEADSLYGVTMKERGVSKLVSVHLKDMNDQLVSKEDGGNYVN